MEIVESAKYVLKKSYITGQKKKIYEYASLLLTKKKRLPGYSGVVVAGFGELEVLPKLREYIVDLIVLNKVRVWIERTSDIDHNNDSDVLPFADDEVIKTLIEGISPGFRRVAYEGALKLILAIPKRVLDAVAELDDTQRQKYVATARKSLPQFFKAFNDDMIEYREQNYTDPIKQSLSSLSISEMGMVAETLLNASQIQKRVSPDLETVGGPVDVAVISKGDGFIWIKRKHYFDPDLNLSFSKRYLER